MTGWFPSDGWWEAAAADAEQMRDLGRQLAGVLRTGDVVVLDGPLGAGKTTLTQGIGEALGVRGAVTSPTFVIARRHPGPRGALVHVDAYRLGDALEVEDLDLDEDLTQAVTVIEWGTGKVEGLAPDRIEVLITRAAGAGPEPGDPAGGPRRVRVRGVGPRWVGLALPGPE